MFENPQAVEANYFRKTKILPIMHVTTLRKELTERYPELPEALFRLLAQSKRWAQHWRRAIPSLVEAWPNQTLDQEQKLFATDPWAYGMEANRHVLDKFLFYCHAQGISAREIAPEDLFHASTVHLTEKCSAAD